MVFSHRQQQVTGKKASISAISFRSIFHLRGFFLECKQHYITFAVDFGKSNALNAKKPSRISILFIRAIDTIIKKNHKHRPSHEPLK